MKVAIFNHPIKDFYISPLRLTPDILKHLRNIIKPYDTVTFDVIKNIKHKINVPIEIKYLKKYMTDDFSLYSFFKSYYSFGDVNNFNHKIFEKFRPDVIIITSFAFCYFDSFNEMVNYLKKKYNIPIICGGSGPSSYPEYYIKNSEADYVIAGPAEITLKKLLDYIKAGNKKNNIENVYTKSNNNSLVNIDKKYDFLPFINIKNLKERSIIQIQATRGCPKKCSYCSVHFTSGSEYLKSDKNDIINQINKLNIKNKKIHINFEDDNISYDKKYFLSLINEIKDKYKDAAFSFENGLDFSTLDKGMIDELIKNGLTQFNVSLTSSNIKMLNNLKREYTLNNFDNFLKLITGYNLPVIVYFISGLPDDNWHNILNTILYLASKNVIIGISNFYPVPNTSEAKKIKTALLPVVCKASSFYSYSKMSKKDLVTFFIISRFINSIKKIIYNDWENIKMIKLNIKNCILTRQQLTMFSIIYSIKKNKIYGIIKRNCDYRLIRYQLSKKIIKLFFKSLKNNLIIVNSEGIALTKSFWKNICKNMFL